MDQENAVGTAHAQTASAAVGEEGNRTVANAARCGLSEDTSPNEMVFRRYL